MKGFIKRVQNTAALYSLWSPKESFILGISGGPDSLCLLDVFFVLSQKYDFTLHVAHVNYGLRGNDSLLDENSAKERARLYNIPYTILRPKKVSASNLEEKLRDIRYLFFEKLRQQKKFTAIVVAHHRDDQAETFLLRLLRGAGISGLSSMRPKNNYVIRPLIQTSREEILRYLTEREIPYREDTSNTDTQFLRNRIRYELLPLLEKNYQPNVKKLLAETASLLARDYALIENASLLSQLPDASSQSFSCQKLLSLPEPIQYHVLRTFLKPAFAGKYPPKGFIDEVVKALKSSKSKTQTLSFRGLKLQRKGDTVRLLNFHK